jgi:hypothetical protein
MNLVLVVPTLSVTVWFVVKFVTAVMVATAVMETVGVVTVTATVVIVADVGSYYNSFAVVVCCVLIEVGSAPGKGVRDHNKTPYLIENT